MFGFVFRVRQRFFLCVEIASNRYAPHLSSCMGLSRRGAVRGGNAKTKSVLFLRFVLLRGCLKFGSLSRSSSDPTRSASPVSDPGIISDDGKNGKSKGKSKSKRAGGFEPLIHPSHLPTHLPLPDDAEFNLKRKRVCVKLLCWSPASTSSALARLASVDSE